MVVGMQLVTEGRSEVTSKYVTEANWLLKCHENHLVASFLSLTVLENRTVSRFVELVIVTNVLLICTC